MIGKDTKVDKKVEWKTEALVRLELEHPNMTQVEQGKILGVSTKTIQRYRDTPYYETVKLETLNNTMGMELDNNPKPPENKEKNV